MINYKNLLELDEEGFQQFAELNYQTFGLVEGVDSQVIREMCKENKLTCTVFFEDEKMIGSVTYMLTEKLAYYVFIVVSPAERSKGYGSKFLQILNEKYKDRQKLVEIDTISEKDAPDYNIRVSRCNFYERNGFHLTNQKVIVNGLLFDLMCTDGELLLDEYSKLIKIEREFVEQIELAKN